MRAVSGDCVFGGCIAIVFGLDDEYPMGATVHVQHRIDENPIWFCIYDCPVDGYKEVYLDEKNLSRVTPEDEDTIERYWGSNGGVYA